VSEREEAGQQQQYCPNCGAEVGLRNAFCVSCGTRLITEHEEEGFRQEGSPTTDAPSTSSAGTLYGDALRGLPENLLRWFKGLPVALKVAGVVVVGVLPLLILFSPLALVAAVLLLGVSVIAAIKAWQGRAAKGWRIVAVASFVLAFAFAGIYDVLYGGGNSGPTEEAGLMDLGVKGKGARGEAASVYEDVAPELEEVAERWHSSNERLPLLLPRYVPFQITGVERKVNYRSPNGVQGTSYHIKGPVTKCRRNPDKESPKCNSGVTLVLGETRRSAPPPNLPTIEIDGRSYRYDDQDIDLTSEALGVYTAVLWVQLEEDAFFPYEITMVAREDNGDPKPLDEFVRMLSSLERIDPPG
jgi:zinc-ribbon domain